MRMKWAMVLSAVVFSFLLLQGCSTPLVDVDVSVVPEGACGQGGKPEKAGLCNIATVPNSGTWGGVQCSSGVYCTSTAGCRGKTCTTVLMSNGECGCGCL